MSLRARLTLATAAAVAVAIAAACGAAYLIVEDELRGEIDRSLQQRVSLVFGRRIGPRPSFRIELPGLPPPAFGGAPGYLQLVTQGGDVVGPDGPQAGIPATAKARNVAAGRSGPFFADTRVRGIHLRVYTAQVTPGIALQAARPLTEVDRTLHRLGWILLAIGGGGVALAAALGAGVARAALLPVRRLSETASHVAETRDLSRRVVAAGRDELSRLAGSFNTMLEALDDSVRAQRQLVADASHELRTPLTSLRTNVEVLARGDRLAPEERRRMLNDVVAQTEELTALVSDVVELAREHEREHELEEVRLDLLTAGAVERAQRHSPGVRFDTRLEPTAVQGSPERLGRAIGNLLDNAAKWSPQGEAVEVTVSAGEVSVRDHGPGITDEDLPHVFDRFYRATASRGLPGSGLGLAIVRQVAELHGGSAVAEHANGGGARLRIVLPSAE